MTLVSASVWARPQLIGGNRVSQLLVPECDDLVVEGDADAPIIQGRHGRWPAVRGGPRTQTDLLTAILPTFDRTTARVTWSDTRGSTGPSAVLASFEDGITLRTPGQPGALRRAQFGALHAILGYQASGLAEPGVVVMPTGTGKTETMLAWMVAAAPQRLLVLAPSVALREQLASRFERLGVLQREEIVSRNALRPCVARLEHAVQGVDEVDQLVAAANVWVATPHVLQECSPEVRGHLLASMTHLIVDEAHHAPARIWSDVIDAFNDRPILLFTATPYRADGRAVPGRVIFRFPLREAQRDGDYAQFDFAMVPSLEDDDERLARRSIDRLRRDLASGLDHVLLARVDTKVRAEEVSRLYQSLAPDLNPAFLHDGLSRNRHKEVLRALTETPKQCRVIVCVDMLGEGFDLPNLKVAAIHNPRRALSPMVQLIGRLARTNPVLAIGRASVFVKQDARTLHSPIRDLLREDMDWNALLADITEYAAENQERVSELDSSFSGTPLGLPATLLQPKMSAVAYRTTVTDWAPENARTVYGERLVDGLVAVSSRETLAWFVVATRAEPRWGDIPDLSTVTHDLVVIFFDTDSRLLFIHGSDTKKRYDELALAVLGDEPIPVRGFSTFNVFGSLDRIVPTNVGLLDTRDRDKRFSMYVGSSVLEALTEAEKQNKSNTHITANAYEDGARVNISAALSGRFWSMQTAHGLYPWVEWCRRQAKKLVDPAIRPSTIFKDMIIPEPVTERPPYPLLAVEWPWFLYLDGGTSLRAKLDGDSFALPDIGFEVDDFDTSGPFSFSAVSRAWRAGYTGTVTPLGIHYAPTGSDALVENRRGDEVPLSRWLNDHKPTLILAEDRLISGNDRLYAPRHDLPPYPREKLHPVDWTGVDIRTESQGAYKSPTSIQAHMVRLLTASRQFDVLIDDDRAGEAADLVGLRIDGEDLRVTLVHCKFSHEAVPGGRVIDLYEVAGQAIRGARWRDHSAEPLLTHLERRVHNQLRRGIDPFEVGCADELRKIHERARFKWPRLATVIAQPGMSFAAASSEQLRLLAGADSYVRTVTKGSFEVYCSP